MKVAVVTGYNSKKPAGLERALIELLRGFDTENTQGNIEYMVYTSASNDLDTVLESEGIHTIKVVKVKGGKYWKNIGLFFAPKADVYLFNGAMVPLLFSPKNYFVLVYDFAYRYFKDTSIKQKMKGKIMDFISALAFKRARGIVTISDATKENLVEFFHVKKEKITTIYLGVNRVVSLEPRSVPEISDSFFMFIGTLKERKNVLGVVKAFRDFKAQTEHPHKLAIVG